MKQITQEQIAQILNAFYNTNISARDFDTIKKFMSELPEVKTEIKKDE